MATKKDIAALEAEIARLRGLVSHGPTVTAKVSQKGALSVYGLGRYPVTLYASQWRRLIEAIPMIEQTMVDNADALVEKDQTTPKVATNSTGSPTKGTMTLAELRAFANAQGIAIR